MPHQHIPAMHLSLAPLDTEISHNVTTLTSFTFAVSREDCQVGTLFIVPFHTKRNGLYLITGHSSHRLLMCQTPREMKTEEVKQTRAQL